MVTGDCDGNNAVTVDEIVTGINIALGLRLLADCAVFDSGGDGALTVDELLQAVNVALNGPPTTVTRTATPMPSRTTSPTVSQTRTVSPTSTATPGPGPGVELGERRLTVTRGGTFIQSQFRSSAVDGFDIAVDPWLPATFRLYAGALDQNQVAPLELLDDVILGFPLIDGSVACFRFLAEGSGGEVACAPGRGKTLQVVGGTNGAAITATVSPTSPGGSAYLELMSSFAKLPVGAKTTDCAGTAYGEPQPSAWTTANASAEVTPGFGEPAFIAADGTSCDRNSPDFTCGGEPFDCGNWINPNGPGILIHPVLGLDQVGLGGDGAANLMVIVGQ